MANEHAKQDSQPADVPVNLMSSPSINDDVKRAVLEYEEQGPPPLDDPDCPSQTEIIPVSDAEKAYLSFTPTPGVHEVKRTFNPGSKCLSLAIMNMSMPELPKILAKASMTPSSLMNLDENEKDEVEAHLVEK